MNTLFKRPILLWFLLALLGLAGSFPAHAHDGYGYWRPHRHHHGYYGGWRGPYYPHPRYVPPPVYRDGYAWRGWGNTPHGGYQREPSQGWYGQRPPQPGWR